MEKIESYVGHFFKTKKENHNYTLTISDMIAFADEMQSAEGNKLFDTIYTLFRYGYVKGYRAAKAEMKKGGAANG